MRTARLLFIAVAFATLPAMADTIDLTHQGDIGTGTAAIGGDFYVAQYKPAGSTGSGVIEPFLRLHANDTEQGFNTDGTLMPDVVGGSWTHALKVGDIPVWEFDYGNGQKWAYRQFLLDVNQVGNYGSAKAKISLSQIQIFISGGDIDVYEDLTDATETAAAEISFSGLTPIFQLSGGGVQNQITLNYALNSGSGSGDMFLYLPASLFGSDDTKNVIFFSQFGNPPGQYRSNDGFEEWAVCPSCVPEVNPIDPRLPPTPPCTGPGCGPAPVPEPASLLLLGGGLAVLGLAAWRKSR